MARANAYENRPDLGFDEEILTFTYYKYLATANPTIFLAEYNRTVVGFLMAYMYEYHHTTGLYTSQSVLYVEPEFRGHRAAAAAVLLQRFVDWSESLGAREMIGGSDTGFRNESVARLLERFGFERRGYAMTRAADG